MNRIFKISVRFRNVRTPAVRRRGCRLYFTSRMPTRIFTLRPSAAPPCRILVTLMPDAPIVSPAGAPPACAIYLRIPLLPVSSSALSNWIRKYSQVRVDEDTVLTARQIKALQRRNAELEEENLILIRHTQTETKSGPGSFQTASDLHPLPGS